MNRFIYWLYIAFVSILISFIVLQVYLLLANKPLCDINSDSQEDLTDVSILMSRIQD